MCLLPRVMVDKPVRVVGVKLLKSLVLQLDLFDQGFVHVVRVNLDQA